ncbi:MAG: PHP domain-containing protein [Planctomycetia bacterium]|nr:PHP domain-containing protein [Planctomycetia bacterium]
MTNFEIIDLLERTAKYLQFQKEPPEFFQPYLEAALIVSELDFPLEIFCEGFRTESRRIEDEFRSIFRSLNRDCRQDIKTLLLTGSFELLNDLRRKLPTRIKILLELDEIKADKVSKLQDSLKIDSIDGLKIACQQNLVRAVPGFTATEEERILAEIERKTDSGSKIFWINAESIVDLIIETVTKLDQQPSRKEKRSVPFQSWDNRPDPAFSRVKEKKGILSKVVSFFQNRPNQGRTDIYNNAHFPDNDRNGNKNPYFMNESNSFLGRTPHSSFPQDNPNFKQRPFPDHPNQGALPNQFGNKPSCLNSRQNVDERFFPPNGVLERPKMNQSPFPYENGPEHFPQRLIQNIRSVGSFCQFVDFIGKLEFLIETRNPFLLFDKLEKMSFVKRIIKRTGNSLTLILNGQKFSLPIGSQECPDLTVLFYAVPVNRFGAGLLYFSSSKDHWKSLTSLAKKKNRQLNEFGLFDGEKCLTSRSEEKIYQFLDLPFISPEIRHNHLATEWIEKGSPDLISLDDIRGDLHLHTTFTDGTGSLDEMVKKSLSLGYRYIALTDHSKNVVVANGMGSSMIERYWDEIDRVNEKLLNSHCPLKVLKGLEVDILEDGRLDLDDDLLAKADWIIASIHFGLEQSQDRIHSRYLSALQNPYVNVIGHPTDRVLGTGKAINVDLDFLCEEAQRYGKFLEINSQPKRLDLNADNALKAAKKGVKLVISTDSHAVDQMDYMRLGVNLARRSGLTKANIINSLSFEDLILLLNDKRKRN